MKLVALPPWSPGKCFRCGAVRKLIVVHYVEPRYGFVEADARLVQMEVTRCLDEEACRARVAKRRKRAGVRASKLVLAEPKAPKAVPPFCRWCGERIVLVGDEQWRRKGRNYHRGDEFEAGDRNCRSEYAQSFTWSAREAILILAGGVIVCVDCGDECERDGEEAKQWDADHEVPLEDGGEHVIENLRPRCRPCHRVKTARENSARRRG